MATVILRPSGDISLGHSKSGASYGYDCINDTSPDQSSTEITGYFSSISNQSYTSSFYLSSDNIDSSISGTINSITVTVNATHDGYKGSDSLNWTNITLTCPSTGKSSTSSALQFSVGSWNSKSTTISPSTLGLTGAYQMSSLGSLLQMSLQTTAKKYSGFRDSFYLKITQVYFTVDYTPVQVHTCSVIAKDGISKTVSSQTSQIISGTAITCTATPVNHCTFRGWYSDEAGTQLVSTANPYTFNITSNTTLYAFGDEILYTVTIGNADSLVGATASVSQNTGYYGDSVTFTCTTTQSKYKFYGWYTESTFKNRVSQDATYTTTFAAENITLYARVGLAGTPVIIRPSKATDPYPFRWNGNNVDTTTPADTGPSDSLVKNYEVLKTNNVADATTYATQTYPKRNDGSAIKGVMALQLAEGASEIPENATLVDCTLTIKYSITNPDHVYEDCFVAFGLIDYIPNDAMADYDETPVNYRRGLAALDPNATIATFGEADISISRWTAQEIREGHFGVSIEYGNDGTIATTLNVYAVELEVIYSLPEEQYYHITAIPDENTRVQVGGHINVEMINLVSNSYVAGNTRAIIPLNGAVTTDNQIETASLNLYSFSNQNISTTNLYNTSMDLQPMTGESETYYDLMTPYYTEAYGFVPGATYRVSGRYTLTGGNMKIRWGYSSGTAPSSWTETLSDAFGAVSELTDFEYTFTIPESMVGFYIRIQLYNGTTSDKLVFTDLSIVGQRFVPELLLQDITTEYIKQGDSVTIVAKPEGGYRFDGWYSDPEFTQLVSNDATYTISNLQAETTLYAKSNYYCRVVKRTLNIPFGSGATYFNGRIYNTTTGAISNSNVSSGTSGFRTDLDLSSGLILSALKIDVQAACASTNGNFDNGGYINSAGMNILYPNGTAHPVKADWYLEPGRGAASYKIGLFQRQGDQLSPYDTITPCFDFVPLANFRPSKINGVPFTRTNMHASALLNTTKNSKIEYRMRIHQSSNAFALGVNRTTLGLYFEQYDYHAKIVDGSAGISLENSSLTTTASDSLENNLQTASTVTGYEGDPLTLTLVIDCDAGIEGIYEDAKLTKSLSNYVSSSAAGTVIGNNYRVWEYHIPFEKLYQDFTIYIKTKWEHTVTVKDVYEELVETKTVNITQEPPNPVPHGENIVLTATPINADWDVYYWMNEKTGELMSREKTLNLNEYYASQGDDSAPGLTESMTIYCMAHHHSPKLWVGDQKVKYTVRRGE